MWSRCNSEGRRFGGYGRGYGACDLLWPRRDGRSHALPVQSGTGFRGVRLRDSGRYAAEITVDHSPMWLGTFPMPELAAHAYDAVAWQYGRPRSEMNFSDVETAEDATTMAPGFRMVCRAMEEENREARRQLRAAEADEEAMEKLRRENPDLVKTEGEFFASRGEKKPKTEANPFTVAGPSAPMINIEDSDESGLSDSDSDEEFDVDWKTLMRESGL
ncbi:ap2-containing protein [Hordeum vulgare]|nr:ap2-containing protein [Hordeum vulgare]KAI4980071.1 hypothetical protein ZWY2020_016824 [Hordeum vulgare]